MFTEAEIRWFSDITDGMASVHGQLDKKLMKKGKWVPYYMSLTPWCFCKSMLLKITKGHDLSNKTFVVVDTAEFVLVLLRLGVNPCNITYIAEYKYLTKFIEHLKVNVVREPFLNWKKPKNMIIDFIVGNPPYNSSAGGAAGTGGNNYIYRKFTEKALSLTDDVCALVTPKGIIKYIEDNRSDVSYINLITDEYWKFDTCYFISEKHYKGHIKFDASDSIIVKMFSIKNTFSHKFYNGEPNPLPSRRESDNIIHGIIDHKTANNTHIYGDINAQIADMGPKFISNAYGRENSWYVTDLPTYVGGFTFYFHTLQDANTFSLFLKNNKALEYFRRKMKEEKGVVRVCRYLLSFDLSQIITGFEFPVEWQLTSEEKLLIDSIIK
jgi:hypothetical protein